MPIARQLWHLYFVQNCRHTRPAPKNKFVVIVHTDNAALGCLINSNLTNWLRNNPHMLVCEVNILASEHSALSYDSYVDCQDLYPFLDSELTSDRGVVSQQARIDILNAIAKCPTIATKHKNAILTRENWPPKPQNP
jgi:hypothetical protein